MWGRRKSYIGRVRLGGCLCCRCDCFELLYHNFMGVLGVWDWVHSEAHGVARIKAKPRGPPALEALLHICLVAGIIICGP